MRGGAGAVEMGRRDWIHEVSCAVARAEEGESSLCAALPLKKHAFASVEEEFGSLGQVKDGGQRESARRA